MNNLEELIEIANTKLIQAKEKKDEKEILLYEKIIKLFNDKPAVFFEMDMESALKILTKLVPDEKLKETYELLISPESFKELRDKFKI